MKRIYFYLIFIWAFLMLQADLKVTINPYIDWIFTLLLVPVILHNISKIKINQYLLISILFPASFLIFSFLISALNSIDQVKNLLQCFKLILLFFVIFPILDSEEKYVEAAFKAFLLSSLVNFIMLIIGRFFNLSIAWQAGYLRYGTIFNLPGSLYKPGIFVFPYIFYSLLHSFSYKNLALFISSIGIIFFDGSRSGYIGLLIAILYITLIYICESILHNKINFKKAIIITFFGGILVIGFINIINFNLIPGFVRIEIFINNINKFGITNGLEQTDPIRYQMLKKSINLINNNPLVGHGFGTTRVNDIVIHNTYLQTWSDLGILGFISLIFLYFSWILMLPKTLLSIKYVENVKSRAIYYNCVFALFFYDLLALFHPLSVEPSEWITFFIPFIIYSQFIYNGSLKKIS